MQKLTFLLLTLFISSSLLAQNEDNEECRALYNQEKFDDSYQCYAKDNDRIFSVYMAAYLAEFLEYKKSFKKHYKHLLSDDFDSPEQYYYAANLHPKNSKKHFKLLKKGLKKYESDTLLLQSQIEYFINVKDYDQALESCKNYATQNTNLYIILRSADILRLQEKYQMAIPLYEKALLKDEKNYNAHYWIGMIYHDQASALLLLSGGVETAEESEKLEKEAISLLKKALPHIEFAYKKNSKSTDLKSALLTCYKRLGMELKYNMLRDL